MTKLAQREFQALDETSLDEVTGGVTLGLIRSNGIAQVHPALGDPYGDPSLLGLQPTYAPGGYQPQYQPGVGLGVGVGGGVGGGNLVGFTRGAVEAVNGTYGAVPNYVVPTNAGQIPLANIANQLARSTGGAIVFAGDRNQDGRIGAEDFLHARNMNEAQAARAVGDIMDRLHTYAGNADPYGNQSYARGNYDPYGRGDAYNRPFGSTGFGDALTAVNGIGQTITAATNVVGALGRIFG